MVSLRKEITSKSSPLFLFTLMKKEIYTCDGCAKEKGLGNHWYAVRLSGPTRERPQQIEILSFVAASGRDGFEHFCGEECLMRMVARNLPK